MFKVLHPTSFSSYLFKLYLIIQSKLINILLNEIFSQEVDNKKIINTELRAYEILPSLIKYFILKSVYSLQFFNEE